MYNKCIHVSLTTAFDVLDVRAQVSRPSSTYLLHRSLACQLRAVGGFAPGTLIKRSYSAPVVICAWLFRAVILCPTAPEAATGCRRSRWDIWTTSSWSYQVSSLSLSFFYEVCKHGDGSHPTASKHQDVRDPLHPHPMLAKLPPSENFSFYVYTMYFCVPGGHYLYFGGDK